MTDAQPERRFARALAVDAVLFDLDGTLADTAPDLAAAVNRMRVEQGHAPLPIERLRPFASAGARGLGNDRDAKGGGNPAIVAVKVSPEEITAFKKGIA